MKEPSRRSCRRVKNCPISNDRYFEKKFVMPDTFAGQCKFERAKRGDTIVGAVEKAGEEARRGGVEVG